MSWEKVGDFLKPFLPVVGTALGGPLGGKVGLLVSAALGEDSEPEKVLQKLQQDPESITKIKLAELESNKEVLLASYQAQQQILETVNQTMRNESNSDDWFVRRWRPFYGYSVAVTWFIQMFGVTIVFVYTAIKSPEKLADIISQFALLAGSLTALWGIALAVLGVSVHKRSLDKQQGLEGNTKSLLDKIRGE